VAGGVEVIGLGRSEQHPVDAALPEEPRQPGVLAGPEGAQHAIEPCFQLV
jgi:hypothetical protein